MSRVKAKINHIKYLCGNPAIELVEGYIYYYNTESTKMQLKSKHKPHLSNVLVATMIPAHLSPAEFAQFLIACCQGKHFFDVIKILHGLDPAHYLCLIFCDPENLCELYQAANNSSFNPLEDTTCSLYLVKHLTTGCSYKNYELNKQTPCTQPESTIFANKSYQNIRLHHKDVIIKRAKQIPDRLRSKIFKLFQHSESNLKSKFVRCTEKIPILIDENLSQQRSKILDTKSNQWVPKFHVVSQSNDEELLQQFREESLIAEVSSFDSSYEYFEHKDLMNIFQDNEWAKLYVKDYDFIADATKRSSSEPPLVPKTSLDCFVKPCVDVTDKLWNKNWNIENTSLFTHPAKLLDRYAAPAYCAVCLERVNYFMTSPSYTYDQNNLPCINVLCGHTFHAQCLFRWNDLSCPCCRYQQYPTKPTCCDICGQIQDLAMCLVCGFTGCFNSVSTDEPTDNKPAGPETSKTNDEGSFLSDLISDNHAYAHYDDTQHIYALDIRHQRIWDFASNSYIHRLVQNIEDGKIIPVEDAELIEAKKLEDALFEAKCIELLHTYLDSLQEYYDKQLQDFQKAASEIIQDAEDQYIQLLGLKEKKQKKLEDLQKEFEEAKASLEEKEIELAKLEEEEKLLIEKNNELKKKDQIMNDQIDQHILEAENTLKKAEKRYKELLELSKELEYNYILTKKMSNANVAPGSSLVTLEVKKSNHPKKKKKR